MKFHDWRYFKTHDKSFRFCDICERAEIWQWSGYFVQWGECSRTLDECWKVRLQRIEALKKAEANDV